MEGGIVKVGYTPKTGIIEVRLSVSRWLNQQKLINYPLKPLTGVMDLRLPKLARVLSSAFDIQVSGFGDEWKAVWPLWRWAVVEVAYAIDPLLSDPAWAIGTCVGLKRTYGAKPRLIGNPAESLLWKSGGMSSKFYDKSREILSQLSSYRGDPDARHLIEMLARSAAKRVRFEVTYEGVRSIRRLWRTMFRLPKSSLPTLALMAHPTISAWALSVECKRLGLYEPRVAMGQASMTARSQQLMVLLDEARGQVLRGERFLPRKKKLSREHAAKLFMAYFALAGRRLPDAAAFLDRSESTVREWQTELRALGLHPDSSEGGGLGEVVQELMTALQPHLLDDFPPEPGQFQNLARSVGTPFVLSPWTEAPDESSDPTEAEEEKAWPTEAAVDWSDVLDGDGHDTWWSGDADEEDSNELETDVSINGLVFDPARGRMVQES